MELHLRDSVGSRVFLYVLLGTLAYTTKKAADLLFEEWVAHLRARQ
jgi:hypothetical protein